MKLKVIFTYDIDPLTGEMTLLAKEEVTVDTTKEITTKKSTTKVDSNPEPIVTLDSNKLILTQGAYDLLKICEDCRIDVKYKKKDKQAVPVIGTDQAFSTKGGNKVTAKLTVSFRGASNEKLAAYGDIFRLEPTEDEGIFYLVGNKKENPIPSEMIDIESELDIEALDNLMIDEDDTNLENIEFKL